MPTYEAALISGLERRVSRGNKVVIVGAGIGITAAVSAKIVGETGEVICIDGSTQCLENTRETLALNELSGNVKLVHAIVGENISVYKSKTEAQVMPASDLQECDVLELDCEGAELKILSEMTLRPKTILVETHGSHGAPTHASRDLLEGMGYNVENLGVAEPYLKDYCTEKDIYVLMGSRDS